MGVSGLPTSSPPNFSTISPSLIDLRVVKGCCPRAVFSGAAGSFPRIAGAAAGLFFGGQRLDDFVGDVDARTAVDRLLQNEVVFLRFRDLADHAVGALEKRRKLFVAAQVQVFAKLALHALEFAANARELLLFRAAVAFAHG